MLNELIRNIEKVHTTELGVVRIKKNLSLDTDDVVFDILPTASNVNFSHSPFL